MFRISLSTSPLLTGSGILLFHASSVGCSLYIRRAEIVPAPVEVVVFSPFCIWRDTSLINHEEVVGRIGAFR